MATIINVDFWTLLRRLNSALERREVELCLNLLQMMTYVDDAEPLDGMKLIEDFEIVLVIKKAGKVAFDIWQQVVSEGCWKRHYNYFLQEEINNLTRDVLVSDNSIKIYEKKWIKWEPSYDVRLDIVRIQLMCNIYFNSEWELTQSLIEALLEEISTDAEGKTKIVKTAIKDESDKIFDSLE